MAESSFINKQLATIKGGFEASPEEKKKAQRFFERAGELAETRSFDYAIEMYIQGFNFDPDNVEQHKALREMSLQRKIAGGKDASLGESLKRKLIGKDQKQIFLNALYLLAKSPGSIKYLEAVFKAAHRCKFYGATQFYGPILFEANAQQKKPNADIYLLIKDVYKDLELYPEAIEACNRAYQLRPTDAKLEEELKNLSAMHTMKKGHYDEQADFRESIRDKEQQQQLQKEEALLKDKSYMMQVIEQKRQELAANPDEPSKVMELAEALARTEEQALEDEAIELLLAQAEKTGQFSFKLKAGEIRMRQNRRRIRMFNEKLRADPSNTELRKQAIEFSDKAKRFELEHFTECVQQYPTDNRLKYELALRQYALGMYDEAIPNFQLAQQDPRSRLSAINYVGLCFMHKNWLEQAIEQFKTALAEHEIPGDDLSKELYYNLGRCYEAAGDKKKALEMYNKVVQWQYTYRDVRERIEKLRTSG